MVASWSHPRTRGNAGAEDAPSTEPKVRGSNPLERVPVRSLPCRLFSHQAGSAGEADGLSSVADSRHFPATVATKSPQGWPLRGLLFASHPRPRRPFHARSSRSVALCSIRSRLYPSMVGGDSASRTFGDRSHAVVRALRPASRTAPRMPDSRLRPTRRLSALLAPHARHRRTVSELADVPRARDAAPSH